MDNAVTKSLFLFTDDIHKIPIGSRNVRHRSSLNHAGTTGWFDLYKVILMTAKVSGQNSTRKPAHPCSVRKATEEYVCVCVCANIQNKGQCQLIVCTRTFE